MIVLDTHVLVWWVDSPTKLPPKVQKIIEKVIKKEEKLIVSAISVWEIFMLVKKGKLGFAIDINAWLQKIESMMFLEFIPVDNQIAAKSVNLPGKFHNDPADRIIIATAREYGAKLVTSDQKILNYRHVQSIW